MHSLCDDHSGAAAPPITTRLPLGLSARVKGPLPWAGMAPDHMINDALGSTRLRYTTCPALVISRAYLRAARAGRAQGPGREEARDAGRRLGGQHGLGR